MKSSNAALQYDKATGDRLTLRPDDFPTKEELESGFPVTEYRTTIEYLWQQQQERQQLAKEDERVLLTLYQRLPELQEQITPPYGVRLDSGRANGRENRSLEGRRIGGRVYEIAVPVSVR